MQYLNINKVHRLMMALALFAGGSQTALAVGTPSGDLISNTATVDYQVGANARSASGSAPDITVDNRVDVTVANQDGGNVNVSPGQADRVQTYLVTNTGNTTQGYILTTAVPTAGIPMGSIEIWLDTNGNGTWDGAGLDTLYVAGSNAFDLDPNGAVGADVETVFIVADTPAGATNGSVDDFRLVAQTTDAGTNTVTTAAGAPTAGVDVVFADGAGTTSEAANDGQHSDAANYTVTSALLALAKTVLGTVDEFATGFAIPGASVEYQLRVTNSGTGSVDNNTVVVTDAIPANTKVCVAGACGGLPTFVDGATTSGLTAATFQYSIVASPNECAPGSFVGYSPTADADGADAAVTCIRQAPTGAMNGSGGFFDVRFFVVIE
jgi:uncharacterized repeat protein (TIGR01451 family)